MLQPRDRHRFYPCHLPPTPILLEHMVWELLQLNTKNRDTFNHLECSLAGYPLFIVWGWEKQSLANMNCVPCFHSLQKMLQSNRATVKGRHVPLHNCPPPGHAILVPVVPRTVSTRSKCHPRTPETRTICPYQDQVSQPRLFTLRCNNIPYFLKYKPGRLFP